MDGHRHGLGPEHDFEPELGLPEPLPVGERILWQGSPDARALAVRAFHVRKIAVYVGLVVAAQVALALTSPEDGFNDALRGATTFAFLAAIAMAMLVLIARWAAHATVYTVTDRRVVMRIGIVLTMTFNLPYARIVGAGVRHHADGTADLPMTLAAGDAIAYAQLWPHARPWRVARPEPMLRCVPDGVRVGRLLADAWAQTTGGTARTVATGVAPAAGQGLSPDGATALAGR